MNVFGRYTYSRKIVLIKYPKEGFWYKIGYK